MSDARKSGNWISVRHRDQKGLDFWARRKAAVQAEEREEALAIKAQEQAVVEAELAERSDEDVLAELELPDPDTLEEGDDFKVFLTDAVPARIRTRALRRLWRVNPVLANVDGLVDYGEDFNDASFIIENMQTAYQVGKGMTEHVLELARKAEEAEMANQAPDAEDAAEQDANEAPEIAPEPAPEVTPDADLPELLVSTELDPDAAGPTATLDEIDETPAFAPSRRMRFVFETQADAPEGALRA